MAPTCFMLSCIQSETRLKIVLLKDVPHFVNDIATIYFQEWGWHYKEDWGMNTYETILDDLKMHHMESTYILTSHNEKKLVGTVSILEEDLLSHHHLRPWVTCLYVLPKYRGKGYGTMLLRHVMTNCEFNTLFLWCYEQSIYFWYLKCGWKLHEIICYHDKPAYILSYIPTRE